MAKPIVSIETGGRIEATIMHLLRALEEAGVIELQGDYADKLRDGTARMGGFRDGSGTVRMDGTDA